LGLLCESNEPGERPLQFKLGDFNHNGYTDPEDLKIIRENLGTNCKRAKDTDPQAPEEDEDP